MNLRIEITAKYNVLNIYMKNYNLELLNNHSMYSVLFEPETLNVRILATNTYFVTNRVTNKFDVTN